MATGSFPSRGGRQYVVEIVDAAGQRIEVPKDPGNVQPDDRNSTIAVRQGFFRETFNLDVQQTKKLLWLLQSLLARDGKGPTRPPKRDYELDKKAVRFLGRIIGVEFNATRGATLEIESIGFPPPDPFVSTLRSLLVICPFLGMFATVFVYVLVFTDQGLDIWRSTQGDVWAAIRLCGAIGILTAVCFGSGVALFWNGNPGGPRRFGLTEDQRNLVSAAAGTSFLPAMFASTAFALLLPDDVYSVGYFVGVIGTVAATIALFALAAALTSVLLRRRFVAGIGGFVLVVAIGAVPAELGEWLGPALILSLGLSGWLLLILELASWIKNSRKTLLSVLLPIVLGLSALKLLTSCALPLPPDDIIRGTSAYNPRSDFATTLQKVIDQQDTQSKTIVIIAAAGGGIRASYWTSTVLTHLIDQVPRARNDLFLASGVSGGSVGLSLFRVLLSPSGHCAIDEQVVALEACADKFHQRDFLAGLIGAMVTRDVINFFAPILPPRSVALEQTLEARWRSLRSASDDSPNPFASPFGRLWRDQESGLSLVLNTTSVFGGDRLPISNLHTEDWLNAKGPCKVNIAEHVDLPLSAAANNSARFPFVEQWGWFKTASNAPDTGCKTYEGVADGGFYDNFGAATARDAYLKAKAVAAERKINLRILVVQITSDPNCETAGFIDDRTDRVDECKDVLEKRKEYLTPIWRFGWPTFDAEYHRISSHNGKLQLRRFLFPLPKAVSNPGTLDVELQSRSISGISAARQLKESLQPGDSYYHFSLAGALDAPLGWALSQYSREQIKDRLGSPSNKVEMFRLIFDLSH
ncbi:hypothetical protein ABIB73_000002 [Bradyrhizobium sp. F1.4.3]|uniref:hypothetical protein n=1 Tax=Bradyrhizobium sp. F1.4.3 TaxID=3156356 RepID=UPI00339375F7